MTFEPGRSGNPAGRPRKRDKFERPIATAEKTIAGWLPELIDLKMQLARGVLIEGQTGVYQTPPDGKAIEYLIDRIMGKPTQRQEVEGEIGTYIVNIGGEDDSSAPAE
jgi:hypothetical protein